MCASNDMHNVQMSLGTGIKNVNNHNKTILITKKKKIMKKFLSLVAIAAMAAFGMTSCSSDDDDSVKYSVVDFEGDYFTKLIDNPQYGGDLLYSGNGYSWTDSATGLTSSLTNGWGDNKFWGGGIAISNYIDSNSKEHATYQYQLAVPETNGSKNFAVVYCDASMSFSDGKAYEMVSMKISPTTYQLGVSMNGDGYAKALTGLDDYLTVTITGYNGTAVTGSVTFDLARAGKFPLNWNTVDLKKLGKVTKVAFTMTGSDNSEYGVKHPQYFAIDDITFIK